MHKHEPYKIAESPRYELENARKNLYINSPSGSYGVREKLRIEYQRIV